MATTEYCWEITVVYGSRGTNISLALLCGRFPQKLLFALLLSPPGMGKTQFLLTIRDKFKEKSSFIIGSTSTKKGIIDLVFEKRPQILRWSLLMLSSPYNCYR